MSAETKKQALEPRASRTSSASCFVHQSRKFPLSRLGSEQNEFAAQLPVIAISPRALLAHQPGYGGKNANRIVASSGQNELASRHVIAISPRALLAHLPGYGGKNANRIVASSGQNESPRGR